VLHFLVCSLAQPILLGGHWALVLTWDPPPQGTLHLDHADQEDEGGGGVVRMLD